MFVVVFNYQYISIDFNVLLCAQSSPIPDTPDRDGAQSRMTSPAREYEMFDDEGAILGDNAEEEEEDGEELFNDNMEA